MLCPLNVNLISIPKNDNSDPLFGLDEYFVNSNHQKSLIQNENIDLNSTLNSIIDYESYFAN